MSRNTDEQNQAESRRILDRVAREAESGGRVHRAARAGGARDGNDEADDWIEQWGTRIGRTLGIIIVIGLLIYLGRFLVYGG